MYRKTERAVLKAQEKEMFENIDKEVLPDKSRAALLLSKLRSKIWQKSKVQR
jgi:hypothetical protein